MAEPVDNGDEGQAPRPGRYLEIKQGGARSVWGLAAYVLFFAGVAGLLIVLLMRLGAAIGLATGVVAFMIAYMAWMGHQASKDIRK